MIRISLIFIPVFVIILLSSATAYECFDNNNEFYCKLSSHTPYRFIANHNDSRLNFPGCTEKKMWLIVRHGTRYPSKKHIKSLLKTLPELQEKIIKNFKDCNSKLSADTIEKFNNWKPSFNKKSAMNLAKEGENELIDLAERLQTRFPTLLVEDYNKETYKFKYTDSQRTEISAKSFALGLFGQCQRENVLFPEPEHRDPVLRFYKRCERWRTQIDKNPENCKERDLFIQGEHVQKVVSDVSKRIGFEVDFEDVNYIYMICSFETAWNMIKSPWCEVLSYNDVVVLEYMKDLEYYWVDGYGHSLNYNQACAALTDMFTFFESPDKSLVTAYFTHSGTILKMLSLLGIAQDNEPLTHASFMLHKDYRNWRVSLIDAFASNIAFVLYDCEKEGPSVLSLHQERPVHIPGCPPGLLCPMTIMKNIFPHTKEKCKFDEMCFIDSSNLKYSEE